MQGFLLPVAEEINTIQELREIDFIPNNPLVKLISYP